MKQPGMLFSIIRIYIWNEDDFSSVKQKLSDSSGKEGQEDDKRTGNDTSRM